MYDHFIKKEIFFLQINNTFLILCVHQVCYENTFLVKYSLNLKQTIASIFIIMESNNDWSFDWGGNCVL